MEKGFVGIIKPVEIGSYFYLPLTKKMIEYLEFKEKFYINEVLAIKFDEGKHGKFLGIGKPDFILKNE